MKNSIALAIYLFTIQRKNMMSIFFMFLLPLVAFYFNVHKSGVSIELINSFVAIAPIQMVLFQFGNTIVSYKESGSLIKYQLLGFKPIQMFLGVGLSTLIFEAVYVVLLLGTSVLFTGISLEGLILLNILGLVMLLNIFEFSLVLLLMGVTKNWNQYNMYSTIAFYMQIVAIVFVGHYVTLPLILGLTIAFTLVGLKKFTWHHFAS